jgi:hypothetical protein
MSASPKHVVGTSDPRITIAEPTWRFQTTIPEAQIVVEAHRQRVIAIYRARAQECLERARLARNDDLVAAAHGYLDEAETWTRFADAWASRSSLSTPTAHHNPSDRR